MLELLVMQPTSQSHHVLQHIVLKKVEQGMQNDHTTDKHHEWRFVDPFQSYQNSGIHLIGSIKWNVGYHLIELIIGMPIIEPLFLVLHYSDVDSHVHSYSDIRLTVVATFVICTNQCVPFCISATYFWALNRTDLSIPSQPIQSMPTDLHYVRWTSRSSTI